MPQQKLYIRPSIFFSPFMFRSNVITSHGTSVTGTFPPTCLTFPLNIYLFKKTSSHLLCKCKTTWYLILIKFNNLSIDANKSYRVFQRLKPFTYPADSVQSLVLIHLPHCSDSTVSNKKNMVRLLSSAVTNCWNNLQTECSTRALGTNTNC